MWKCWMRDLIPGLPKKELNQENVNRTKSQALSFLINYKLKKEEINNLIYYYGYNLILKTMNYNNFKNDYYKKIAQVDEKVELVYESSLNDSLMEDILKLNIEKDRKLKYTSDGIHRDNLLFKINDHPLKKYGSQGQQKSFLIALKLAKFNFIREKKGFTPILLLDDIFDKLDHNRVNYLVDLIEKEKLGQTFITDTDLDKVPEILRALKVNFKAFEIQQGNSKEI